MCNYDIDKYRYKYSKVYLSHVFVWINTGVDIWK